MIPYALKYKDPAGFVWHPYAVDFDGPDGKFSCHIYAISEEHAHLQLEALKETGKISGKVEAVFPA